MGRKSARRVPPLQEVWCQHNGQLTPPPIVVGEEPSWPAGYYLCCILTFPTMSSGESFRPGLDKIPVYAVSRCEVVQLGKPVLDPFPPDLGEDFPPDLGHFDPNGIIAAAPTQQVDDAGTGPVQDF